MGNITAKVSIFIAAAPEEVWDFTQDYGRRTQWDRGILEARVEAEHPRVVWVRAPGDMSFRFRYKLEERPRKTSLAITDVTPSWLISGGGGSWSYEPEAGGTRWTNVGTLTIRSRLWHWLLAPLLRWRLRRAATRAMAMAKAMLESR